MLAKDLVSDVIPAVKDSDTVKLALDLMNEFRVSHLPVVGPSGYAGLLSESELRDLNDETRQLDLEKMNCLNLSVLENQHIYEVIDVIARWGLTLLPVITPTMEYRGSILLPALVSIFSTLTAAGQPGAILVIGLSPLDYSPNILARIIEENNAKIMSMYAVPDPDGRNLSVTIKVNTQETSSIMRSMDRYGYSVRSYYMADSQLDDFYRSRYEEFMKYMNI